MLLLHLFSSHNTELGLVYIDNDGFICPIRESSSYDGEEEEEDNDND